MTTHPSRRWRWWLAGCLLIFCAAGGGIGFVLGTSPGRDWLAEQLSSALSSGSQTVKVENIHLTRGMRVGVGRVRVGDSEGAWLEVRGVETQWSLRPLFDGRIEIRSLRVGQFNLRRWPAGDEQDNSSNSMLRLPRFAVESMEVGHVQLSAGAVGVPVELLNLRGRVEGGGEGSVHVGIRADAERVGVDAIPASHVVADVQLLYSNPRLELSGSLNGDGFRTSGQVQFPGDGAWPTGHLRAEVDGTSTLVANPWPDVTFSQIATTVNCGPRPDGLEVAQVHLVASHLRFGEMALESATVATQVQRSPAKPGLSLEADSHLEQFSFGNISVTGAVVRVVGPWGDFDVSGRAAGNFAQAFSLEAGGHLRWDEGRWDVALNQASARWAALQARLTESLAIQMQGGMSSIRGAAILEPFDLASLSDLGMEMPKGKLEGQVRLGGTLASPEIQGEATCGPVGMGTGAWAALPSAEGSCRFSVSGGILRVSTSIQTTTNGELHAEAQVPVRISLVPWALNLDRDADLSLQLQAGLNLALFNHTEYFSSSRLGGQIHLSVAHQGPIHGGTVTGTCVLARGEYENYVLGTVIREAHVRLVSSGESLIIESGRATDGGKGRLVLKGFVRLDPTEGFPYELEADIQKASLLRRPDAEATISGKVEVSGTLFRFGVDGDLQLDNAVVDLRNLRMPAPAVLEPDSQIEPAVEKRLQSEGLALRLALSIPGTLYIRGRELDSAWAGHLILEHEHGQPGLSGYLEPRRGTLLLLKRKFKLEEGRIDFDNRWPSEPLLRLAATFSRADLSARVQLIGSVSDPEWTLTSDPPLPKDEILARILFGEGLSSLTPVQAFSLASEAARLGKLGGGAGWLGKVQAAVGIDRVEIRENGQDSAKTEVAVGKYLGDRSYVEMRRATAVDTTDRARFYMEHELWPNIVVEAESGLEMRSGIGLFWKLDY